MEAKVYFDYILNFEILLIRDTNLNVQFQLMATKFNPISYFGNVASDRNVQLKVGIVTVPNSFIVLFYYVKKEANIVNHEKNF